jgi:endonuclease/exonuclease/phosphatase (EEP) superfamily protein YafD
VLPYTWLWTAEVKAAVEDMPDRQLTILTSNVLTPNRNAEALLQLVRQYQPDILVTLESDAWWQSQLDSLLTEMPYSIKCPLDNLYGMHVYSRRPLLEAKISFLVQSDVPSMHALVKMPCGEQVRMHFLHPAPPSPTENEESSERDAELIMVGRSVFSSDQPVIVTGDLNDVAWSATTRLFRKISGLLDPRIGRGMFNTFHVKFPFLRWPLDHLFHSAHFTVNEIQRLSSIGSDHFPLLARLTLNPKPNPEQEGLDADADDQQWASEITNSKNVSQQQVPRPGSEA